MTTEFLPLNSSQFYLLVVQGYITIKLQEPHGLTFILFFLMILSDLAFQMLGTAPAPPSV